MGREGTGWTEWKGGDRRTGLTRQTGLDGRTGREWRDGRTGRTARSAWRGTFGTRRGEPPDFHRSFCLTFFRNA